MFYPRAFPRPLRPYRQQQDPLSSGPDREAPGNRATADLPYRKSTKRLSIAAFDDVRKTLELTQLVPCPEIAFLLRPWRPREFL